MILTDYFAETDEQECFYRQELIRLKSEQGVDDDAEWGATATIKAIK